MPAVIRPYGRPIMEQLRARLQTLSRGELAGLVVVVVATLLGAGLWYLRSLPSPVQIVASGAPLASAGVPAATAAPPGTAAAGASPGLVASPGTLLIVDVTGWVRRPGVYEFAPGSRVIDAVERAGGARDGAQLAALNLAAPLVDGQQIVVPKRGQVPVPGTVPGTTPGTTGGLINVNTADATALETLNGIGEVLASTIVQYREDNGAFTSVDQLEDVPGIGPATLEEIRDQVTV